MNRLLAALLLFGLSMQRTLAESERLQPPQFFTITRTTTGIVCDDPILFRECAPGQTYLGTAILPAADLSVGERATLPPASRYLVVPINKTVILLPLDAARPVPKDQETAMMHASQQALAAAYSQYFAEKDAKPKQQKPADSTVRYYERKAARDAAAERQVDSYYQFKLRQFLDRQ